MKVRLGTRGSELALWQTNWVKKRLAEIYPELEFETIVIKTTGDKILDSPLSRIGDKGLFTKELDHALLADQIDLAVHSMKDVPTEIPSDIIIAAVTERWDVHDVLISRNQLKLDELPVGATIATGSLRRRAQLLRYRPDFQIVNIRGNLYTRFRKFDLSDWDAMVLALAGVERLNLHSRITQKIPLKIVLPAVGQGALAVVIRKDNHKIKSLLAPIHQTATAKAIRAERALLRAVEGGCQVPLGALGKSNGRYIRLQGCLVSLDGKQYVYDETVGDIKRPEQIGEKLAQKLLQSGGREILKEIRKQNESN